MKTIKLLLLLTVFSAATFYSCSDSDPIEKKNTLVPRESIALRTMLNEVKKANEIGSKPAKQQTSKQARTATNPFCFNFVYPLTLSLSNNTNITVTSFEGLLNVLGSESTNLYVTGIGFPFQVAYGGALHTIANEGEFIALIQYCGFHTLSFDLSQTTCFEFIYPMAVMISDDQLLEVNDNAELQTYIEQNNNFGINLVYPISVNYGGEIVVIHNIYEMYEMINNCNDCICTLEYAPVCVMTTNGIVEFGNMCFAICAGYTQNDLVSCSPNPGCQTFGYSTAVGSCLSDNTYPVTISWEFGNLPLTTGFTVRDQNNHVVGNYTFAQLPLTFPNIANSGNQQTVGYSVTLNNGICQFGLTWTEPLCNTNPCESCPTNFDPVCVQTPTGPFQYDNACLAICAGHSPNEFITCGVVSNNFGTQLGSCFTMNYPVQVMGGGLVVTVNNDGELLQYWNPSVAAIPNMVYPITATFGNQSITFANQAAFQAQIAASCN